MMPCDVYTGTSILIVGFIIINYISPEFIFEEKRLNEISESKFSLKITSYTIYAVPITNTVKSISAVKTMTSPIINTPLLKDLHSH